MTSRKWEQSGFLGGQITFTLVGIKPIYIFFTLNWIKDHALGSR